MTERPYAPSCDRNREPILEVLRRQFATARHVLEIGSGTGQHAVHFAAAMPWLSWQCSDRRANLPGIRLWLDEAGLPNTPPPLALDVTDAPWRLPPGDTVGQEAGHAAAASVAARDPRDSPPAPEAPGTVARFDAVFTANTLHIMGMAEVEAFFGHLPSAVEEDAVLAAYGPFNIGGTYTSESNREFDAWLKARDPRSGIRDVEVVHALAARAGFLPVEQVAMPANNLMLVWRRSGAA